MGWPIGASARADSAGRLFAVLGNGLYRRRLDRRVSRPLSAHIQDGPRLLTGAWGRYFCQSPVRSARLRARARARQTMVSRSARPELNAPRKRLPSENQTRFSVADGMNEIPELASLMLAIAFAAVMLVAGELYIQSRPERVTAIPSAQTASVSLDKPR
jgi:hypothetical protein